MECVPAKVTGDDALSMHPIRGMFIIQKLLAACESSVNALLVCYYFFQKCFKIFKCFHRLDPINWMKKSDTAGYLHLFQAQINSSHNTNLAR